MADAKLLTLPEVRVLRQIGNRNVAVVWHAETEYPRLGLKPWYALTGTVLPTQLHTLWLAGLIRLDRGAGPPLRLDTDTELVVGRARLTPTGKARLLGATSRLSRPPSVYRPSNDRFLSTGRERAMG